MAKLALTMEELKMFNTIWAECWRERGFEIHKSELELKVLDTTLLRYLFKGENQQFVSTIGLRKLSNSETKKHYNLKKNAFIESEMEYVYEVDKLAILKKFRGMKVLSDILNFLVEFSEGKNVKYFVALMEPRLFKSIHRFYGIAINQIADEFDFEGDLVIPVCIDPKEALNASANYHWLQQQVNKAVN